MTHSSATTSPSPDAAALAAQSHASPSGDRLDDLAQIIQAYTQVTDKLEKSHQHLADEVLRLQKELASTDAQLQRSRRLAALGEMAAGIAHEIRNPLAAIGLYAGMLAEDMQTLQSQQQPAETGNPSTATLNQAADTARKISAAVRGLDAIVNDVLTFSREMNPRPARVSVPAIFARAVEAIWPVLDQASIRLALPDADTRRELDDMFLMADAELVHQAMLNLLRNAVDAMTEGLRHEKDRDSKPKTLTLDARQDGAHGVLVVRDTGLGIDQQAIDRIFNPFFTTRDTGTGLGLAIVHRIADVHGGAVTVHNDDGAVFELSLPLATGPVQTQVTQVNEATCDTPCDSHADSQADTTIQSTQDAKA